MLTSMHFDLIFDRPIDSNRHYISPGGYEIQTKENKIFNFDFLNYEGCIDTNNPCKLHVDVYGLDIDAFPNSKNISESDITDKDTIFNEFFVYTGEYDDPEIKPTKVTSLGFEFENGEMIDFISASNLLKSATNALAI